MALTVKMLKGLGLTDEQREAILEEHANTVNEIKAERDRLKADAEKLPGVQRQLEELQAAGDGGYKQMAKKLYEESSVQAIANAIREKNGETTTYKLGEMAAAIQAISAGGGGGETVPIIAVAQFPVAASIEGDLGSLTIDFSGLQQYMSATKTYAWSLIMWRSSQVETEKSYAADSFCINGRVSKGSNIDANDCRLTRTPPAALTSPYQLNVTDFKKSRTVTGTAVTIVSSVPATEWAGDYIGLFTLLPPYTDAYTGDKLTECPDGFLTFAAAEESTQSADIPAEDALSIITGGVT